MKPEEWIVSRDVGTSSKTIWAVMMGIEIRNKDSWDWGVPHDSDDFGRCYRLITLFPHWRKRLPEVAAVFPQWKPMVDHWDELTALYLQYLDKKVDWHRFYDFIQDLEHEGMKLNGWVQDSPGSWHKGEARSVTLTADSAKRMSANIDAILKKGKTAKDAR